MLREGAPERAGPGRLPVKPEAASTLYPLALFLLQDLDYIQDPSLGPVAHERRLAFETNFKDTGNVEVLDRFYEELAKPASARRVPMQLFMRDSARVAFEAWAAKEDREAY